MVIREIGDNDMTWHLGDTIAFVVRMRDSQGQIPVVNDGNASGEAWVIREGADESTRIDADVTLIDETEAAFLIDFHEDRINGSGLWHYGVRLTVNTEIQTSIDALMDIDVVGG